MPRGMRRRMHDMARRMEDLRRRRDMRDMRNPYGSEGGYVVSRRRDGLMYDDMPKYEETRNYDYYNGDQYARENDYDYAMNMNRRRNYAYEYDGRRAYDYARNRIRDYAYDYGYDFGEYETLSEDELMEWSKELMQEVEPKDKAFFAKDNVKKRAETMNIKFDQFTPEEFYTTALMAYTDYKDVLGTTNLDVYLPVAKAWLMDKDSDLKGGEKLAAYYYYVVCADEE